MTGDSAIHGNQIRYGKRIQVEWTNGSCAVYDDASEQENRSEADPLVPQTRTGNGYLFSGLNVSYFMRLIYKSLLSLKFQLYYTLLS